MVPVVIAIGSNIGDKFANLQNAINSLAKKIEVLKTSGVYETAPMYVTDQPPFMNAAVYATTDLEPIQLLAVLKAIESQQGREKRERFGPREIDLDLIVYGETSLDSPDLQIPHPRLAERRFVLLPLSEVWPFPTLAKMGKVEDLLSQTQEQAEAVVLKSDAILSIPSHR